VVRRRIKNNKAFALAHSLVILKLKRAAFLNIHLPENLAAKPVAIWLKFGSVPAHFHVTAWAAWRW